MDELHLIPGERVDFVLSRWLCHGPAQHAAIVECSRSAVLAVRVYVRLQNSRKLPAGHTRKDFVRCLEAFNPVELRTQRAAGGLA